MTTPQDPIRIVIKELLPFGIIRDVQTRLKNTPWPEFFATLWAIGFLFLFTSLSIIAIVFAAIRLFLTTSGITDIFIQILGSLSFIAVGGYVFTFILLNLIENVVQGRILFSNIDYVFIQHLRSNSGWPAFVLYVINAVLSGLIIAITFLFRSTLIIGNVPEIQGFLDFDAVFGWILILTFDTAYIGLVLVSAAQIYGTTSRLMSDQS